MSHLFDETMRREMSERRFAEIHSDRFICERMFHFSHVFEDDDLSDVVIDTQLNPSPWGEAMIEVNLDPRLMLPVFQGHDILPM